MFVVHASYLSLLCAVCRRLDDVSVHRLTEILEDGSIIHGLEVEISAQSCLAGGAIRIFWDYSVVGCVDKFESAALQAVIFLQSMYGFVVVDYNYYGMLSYRSLANEAAEMCAAAADCCHDASKWDDLPEEMKSSLCARIQLIKDRDMAFAPLSDLPVGRAYFPICARVVRLWDYCGNKEDQPPLHVDMVLVDDKENRMYAEIPGAEAGKFKSLINEGRVYAFRKFVVSACKPAYKPFQSNQMIRFTPWTTVEEKAEMEDKLPRYVFDLIDFQEFPSRVGQVECFIDTIGVIVGVSEVAYVHLPSNQNTTAKRVISLKDLRNNQINLVLWGSRATDFDAEGVHSVGQDSPVVAIFVGMLLRSYKAENTLSGGSACKWYINEEIPEIENFFDRLLDAHTKIEWISAGEQQFRALEQQRNLEEKTVMQLRDMDPWEFEGSGYRCTVTISRINNKQPWWFSSCTKCHRASAPCGSQYKCSGGCPCTTAEPKYRLSLIGTDGTATAEFTLFGRVARQIVGKPVVSLIRSATKNQHGSSGAEFEHMLPELAALVSQKFTFSVSISQKNLTQRSVSFQVNGVLTFFGKQAHIPEQRGVNYDGGAGSSAIVSTPTLNFHSTDVSNPPKRARLDRKTIPCKKSLTFDTSDNGAQDTSLLNENNKSKDVMTQGQLSTDSINTSDVLAEAPTADDSAPSTARISDAGKIAETTQIGGKNRSGGSRKKAAS